MSHFICYTSGGITLHPCSDFWSLFNEHSKGISSQCVERYCGMADCAVHFASLVFVFFCYKHMKKKPKMSDHPEWGICSVHYVKLGFSKHEELFPCSREALCSVDFSHCVMCSPSVNHPLSWRTANAWIFSTRAHVYSAFKGWMAIFSHSQVLLSVPLKLLDDYSKKFLNS